MPRFDPHPQRRPTLITGASSGIGRATALALAAAGHPVALGARRVQRCEEVAAEIRTGRGEAWAGSLDLLDGASVTRFVADAVTALGPIEVLVSNAGDVRPLRVDGDPDEFRRQLEVNLLGPQRLLHELVPSMVTNGRGDVVVVTSEVSQRPRPHMAGYVASKAGLERLIDALRMEVEGTGVRVGVVRPGPAATEQGSTWSAEDIESVMTSWAGWGLLRHDGYLRPQEVAEAIVSMVSMPRGTQITHLEIQPEAPVVAAVAAPPATDPQSADEPSTGEPSADQQEAAP